MTLDDFVSLASEKLPRMAWLIGAGVSQSANLPTAYDVMWDLKRRYYCEQENQAVASNDLQNAAVREKISQYLLSKGFPEPGDPEEYGRCFELIFGVDHQRQQRYIAAMLSDERVSLTQGHRIFAALVAMKSTKVVFTTNFDNVVEKALAEVAGQSIAAYHLEGSAAATEAMNEDAFPIYCKLHGDFRYQSLKNLPDDLAHQNANLSTALKIACNRFGLIVGGYSGRDASVVELLTDVLTGQNPFPHGLYWLGLKGRAPLPAVVELLEAAAKKGVTAEFVEIETFDSLMARLWKQLPASDPAIAAKVGRTDQTKVSIPIPDTGTMAPIIRLNGLPLKLPGKCLKLALQSDLSADELMVIEDTSGGTVCLVKGDGAVWGWGIEPSLQKSLGSGLNGVSETDIADRFADLDHNLFLKPLVERSIALGLTRGRPLIARRWRDRMMLVVKDSFDGKGADDLVAAVNSIHGSPALKGVVPDLLTVPDDKHPNAEPVRWAEALELSLEEVDGTYWLLVKPQFWIWPTRSRRDADAFLDARRSKRYNAQTDLLISAWIKFLLPSEKRNVDHVVAPFGDTDAKGAPRFVIHDRTSFSRRSTS